MSVKMMLDNSTRTLCETEENSQANEYRLDGHNQPPKPMQLTGRLVEDGPEKKRRTKRDGQPKKRNETKEARLRSTCELTATSNDI
jgi:hypothetical protein